MSELIDNRAHRISVLKEIIYHLHEGAAPELVREQLRKIVGETMRLRLWPWSNN